MVLTCSTWSNLPKKIDELYFTGELLRNFEKIALC